MSLRFNLTERQLFSLTAAFAVVGIMVFGTGILYGIRWAEQENPARAGNPNTPGSEAAPVSATSAASDTTSDARSVYEIQLSSHLHREDTEPLIDTLTAAGYEAFVVETRDSGDRELYTVRIGPWKSILEAADAADAFRERSELDGFDPKIRRR